MLQTTQTSTILKKETRYQLMNLIKYIAAFSILLQGCKTEEKYIWKIRC